MKHPEAALRAYRDLLVAEPVSVTSVRDPEAAWDLHVADALTALELVLRLEPGMVVDVEIGRAHV